MNVKQDMAEQSAKPESGQGTVTAEEIPCKVEEDGEEMLLQCSSSSVQSSSLQCSSVQQSGAMSCPKRCSETTRSHFDGARESSTLCSLVCNGCESLLDLPNEILIMVLHYIPICDRLLNVARTCRQLQQLCLNRSLTTHLHLASFCQMTEHDLKDIIKKCHTCVKSLSLANCYWIHCGTFAYVSKCHSLRRLDLSGCALTTLCLSKILAKTKCLNSLGLDIRKGFQASQLKDDAINTLLQITELKQTMVITSYGLLFHCPNIKKLLLYITVRSDVMGVAAKDIGTHAIGTCYKNLTCFVLMVSPFSLSTEWFLWSFFHFHMMEAKLEVCSFLSYLLFSQAFPSKSCSNYVCHN
uniref:F-box/LRR-repeat protein 18-like n=1 Tax=Myxine glutinosa TaxID=7769 RepID=UPI00358E57BA